ncbi:LuxR C-terminal-related transcriptional regulator [Streptomyces sp. NPDC019531]|uniref:helix-turn-helix transcriptional regulator n=1 Tax=Streptomyces sp. NPDC019531 TaxID=3365062 RepID=UPI00385142D9
MTFERDAKTLELPWPFTGREDELELVRRSVAGGRHGIVVTGPAGRGKTRLVTEAVRGTDCARVAGTPETRKLPFAAFAHLLPETVSLHRAVQLLSGVRLLLVDDAHLLDDASAALVHQLALHARTRLVVVATDGAQAPGAISRLWTGELLPRLALEPLPREETAQLLAAGAGALEALTVNRLHRLCRGDLRLLRELVDAVREQGQLIRVPDSAEWQWRGPVPITPAVRERTAHLLDRTGPGERETLEQLAFGEPLPMNAETFDLYVLEGMEADGLVHVDDHGTVRLADPLHGPVLRAAAGRLRARRLARTPADCMAALETETATLTRAIGEKDVRAVPAPVGEWLLDEGAGIPPRHAAARARFARLRGELREAASWAREGLRATADDRSCSLELTLAAAQSGDTKLAAGSGAAGLPEPSSRSGDLGSAGPLPPPGAPCRTTPSTAPATSGSATPRAQSPRNRLPSPPTDAGTDRLAAPMVGRDGCQVAARERDFGESQLAASAAESSTDRLGVPTVGGGGAPNAAAEAGPVGGQVVVSVGESGADRLAVSSAGGGGVPVGVAEAGPVGGQLAASAAESGADRLGASLAGGGVPVAAAEAGPVGGQFAVSVAESGADRLSAPTVGRDGVRVAELGVESGGGRLSAAPAESSGAQLTQPTAESGTPPRSSGAGGSADAWRAAARGDLDAALGSVTEEPYDAVRLGAPDRAVGRLTGVFAAHAEALARRDGPALDRAAHALEERGFLLFAAEAYAHAVRAHRDPSAARTSRSRAVALARRCQGARTPALSGLVLGELTARQRQVVTLAAAGLSNRQIAEKLTLSIRTVGNHLYSAYTRLGASDRDALPCLVELPEAQPA